MPFISILVMSHNQERFIGACLDSVFAQQYDGPAEIIVCDDASTDATFACIEEKARAYQGTCPLITHRCEENGGVAVNMNVAVSLSRGQWLMRVDGDDILHPDRLRLSALAIMKHPGASVVSGVPKAFTGTPSALNNPPDTELEFKLWNRYSFSSEGELATPGLEWWGGVMTMSRHLFEVFGDMPRGCNVLDDTMFATRALMLGDFVIISNATLLYYRRHGGNISSGRKEGNRTPMQFLKEDLAGRDYYRRGIPCHEPILCELEAYTATHNDCRGVLQYFRKHLAELRRQALFWQKPWKERIADGGVSGLRALPWALRCSCPLAYATLTWLKQRLHRMRGGK